MWWCTSGEQACRSCAMWRDHPSYQPADRARTQQRAGRSGAEKPCCRATAASRCARWTAAAASRRCGDDFGEVVVVDAFAGAQVAELTTLEFLTDVARVPWTAWDGEVYPSPTMRRSPTRAGGRRAPAGLSARAARAEPATLKGRRSGTWCWPGREGRSRHSGSSGRGARGGFRTVALNGSRPRRWGAAVDGRALIRLAAAPSWAHVVPPDGLGDPFVPVRSRHAGNRSQTWALWAPGGSPSPARSQQPTTHVRSGSGTFDKP